MFVPGCYFLDPMLVLHNFLISWQVSGCVLQGMPYFHSNAILEQTCVEGWRKKNGGCVLSYSEKKELLDQQNRRNFNLTY